MCVSVVACVWVREWTCICVCLCGCMCVYTCVCAPGLYPVCHQLFGPWSINHAHTQHSHATHMQRTCNTYTHINKHNTMHTGHRFQQHPAPASTHPRGRLRGCSHNTHKHSQAHTHTYTNSHTHTHIHTHEHTHNAHRPLLSATPCACVDPP